MLRLIYLCFHLGLLPRKQTPKLRTAGRKFVGELSGTSSLRECRKQDGTEGKVGQLDSMTIAQRPGSMLHELWGWDSAAELAHRVGLLAFSSTEPTLSWSWPQGKSGRSLSKATPFC